MGQQDKAQDWHRRMIAGLGRILRDPLAIFLLAGGLLFLAIGSPQERDDTVIVVDPATRERLSRLYEAQMGAFPSAGEMQGLVDRHLRDEMLYREALRLGLDEGDEIIRKRLIQKMEYLIEGDAGEPGEEELRAFFEDNPERFGVPSRTSFRQAYFDPDREGWDAAESRAEKALAAGNPGAGDPGPVLAEYQALGTQDAAQLFGDTQIAKALGAAPIGRWSGPYRSGYGWHLLFVSGREEAITPPFEEVSDAVRGAYGEARRSSGMDDALAELAGRYEVRTTQ